MHRYRIVAQTSVILFIISLVLAAPILVQEIHEVHANEMGVAEDVAVKRKKRYMSDSESEAAPSGSTPLPSNPDAVASPPSNPDVVASPQHSSHSSLSDGSTSSGYPSPYLSSGSSGSGYSWLLERPPRLHLPASLIQSPSPYPSSSGLSGLPRPVPLAIPSPHIPRPSSPASPMIQHPEWMQDLVPEIPPSFPLPPTVPLDESAYSHHSSSGSSDMRLTEWLQDLVPGLPSHPYLPLLHDFSPEGIAEPLPIPPMEPEASSPPHLPWWYEFPAEMWESWLSRSSSGSEASSFGVPPHAGLDTEIPPSPQHSGTDDSDRATSENYSPTNLFTPSHHSSSSSSSDGYSEESVPTQFSSASDGSLPSHYFSASDEDESAPMMPDSERLAQSHHLTTDESPPVPTQYSSASDGSLPLHYFSGSNEDESSPIMPEELAQAHHLTTDESPPSPPSPPTETSPDKAEFFDKAMMKKIGIVAGALIAGGTIAGIVGSQIKHHEHRDCPDS